MEDRLEGGGSDKYFVVDPIKFVLMSVSTFGLYELYWSYKNWVYIRNRDQSKILPFGRAFFYPLWYYSLLTDIAEHSSSTALTRTFYRSSLAIILLVLGAVYRLPDPYWLASILTFFPMLPAVNAISAENATAGPIQHKPSTYRPANFAAFIFGGPLVAFLVLSSVGVFPSTAVVSGTSLNESQLSFLRDKQILGEGEEVLYFYSEGLFSIAEGGQFISDEYVTSYWVDPENDEIAMAYANYSEIEDFGVSWASSPFESTIITIKIENGGQFDLWLSSEHSGDKLFVSEMKANWRKNRVRPADAGGITNDAL